MVSARFRALPVRPLVMYLLLTSMVSLHGLRRILKFKLTGQNLIRRILHISSINPLRSRLLPDRMLYSPKVQTTSRSTVLLVAAEVPIRLETASAFLHKMLSASIPLLLPRRRTWPVSKTRLLLVRMSASRTT